MKTITVEQFRKFRPYAASDAAWEHEVEMLRELLKEGDKQ